MKNIHILPTDKPSRLGKFIDTNNLFIRTSNDIPRGENVNIYITNSEEIKEGDYKYHHVTGVRKALVDGNYTNQFKIILTTDQDLIGVQAIDDEFLEWFSENPSCEEVEVIYTNCANCVKIQGQELSPDCCHNYHYKIIIPKEELKTSISLTQRVSLGLDRELKRQKKAGKQFLSDDEIDKLVDNIIKDEMGDTWKESYKEPKQETLEEAAKGYSERHQDVSGNLGKYLVSAVFQDGAKWQQERMYSEEEVLTLVDNLFHKYSSDFRVSAKIDTKEWFEQFKKKEI